jgi:hypothetical protein
MANKHRKVWKVVSRKLLSGKQTWSKDMLSFCNEDEKVELKGVFRGEVL